MSHTVWPHYPAEVLEFCSQAPFFISHEPPCCTLGTQIQHPPLPRALLFPLLSMLSSAFMAHRVLITTQHHVACVFHSVSTAREWQVHGDRYPVLFPAILPMPEPVLGTLWHRGHPTVSTELLDHCILWIRCTREADPKLSCVGRKAKCCYLWGPSLGRVVLKVGAGVASSSQGSVALCGKELGESFLGGSSEWSLFLQSSPWFHWLCKSLNESLSA